MRAQFLHDVIFRCLGLYEPVCAAADGQTYSNSCHVQECAGGPGGDFTEGPCGEAGDGETCVCNKMDKPVCADEDGKSYANACFVKKCAGGPGGEHAEGKCAATTTAPEACACPGLWAPVCGADGNTYGNTCEAGCKGVKVAGDGECNDSDDDDEELSCFCNRMYSPVCSKVDGKTYGNSCLTKTCAGGPGGAFEEGQCRDPADKCTGGQEYDAKKKACVDVSCDAEEACDYGTQCVKRTMNCFTTPCPQFACVPYTCSTISDIFTVLDGKGMMMAQAACEYSTTTCDKTGGGCTWDTKARACGCKAVTTIATMPSMPPKSTTTTTTETRACGPFEAYDTKTNSCVAVQCGATPPPCDAEFETCTDTKRVCKTAPCIQYVCNGRSTLEPTTEITTKPAADTTTEQTTLAPTTVTPAEPITATTTVPPNRSSAAPTTSTAVSADTVAELKAQLELTQGLLATLQAQIDAFTTQGDTAALNDAQSQLAMLKVNAAEQEAAYASASSALNNGGDDDDTTTDGAKKGSTGLIVGIVVALVVIAAAVAFVVLKGAGDKQGTHFNNPNAQYAQPPSNGPSAAAGTENAGAFENPAYDSVA